MLSLFFSFIIDNNDFTDIYIYFVLSIITIHVMIHTTSYAPILGTHLPTGDHEDYCDA
jgi:hypothetical protein